MPVIKCPLERCTYETPDVDASIVAELLILHSNDHTNATYSKPKPPNMDRPRIGSDCNEVEWNMFLRKWAMFKDSTEMSELEKRLNCTSAVMKI